MTNQNQNRRTDPGYKEWVAIVRPVLADLQSVTRAEVTNFGSETIKHIALICLAGLAGTFTIISTKDSGLLTTAAILFATGSLCCIAAFYCGYRGRLDFSNRIRITLSKIDTGTYTCDGDWMDEKPSTKLEKASGHFSFAATIFAVTGGLALFLAL